MLLKELLERIKKEPSAFSSLAFDSREVKDGSIFFSIPGVKEDGAKYIGEAVARGASLVIAEEGVKVGSEVQVPVLKVENVRKVLAMVARCFYKDLSTNLKLIGVTGTNGKTSTCWILSKILSRVSGPSLYMGTLGAVIMDEGREIRLSPEVQTTRDILFNYSMLDLAIKYGCTSAVLEVTSHGLTQYRTHGLQWDVGAFTNLTPEHLDYHVDMESYARAKAIFFKNELVESSKKDKSAIVNVDDRFGAVLVNELSEEGREYSIFKYSKLDKAVDLVLLEEEVLDFGSRLTFKHLDQEFEFESSLLGAFNYENLCCVLSVLLRLGFSVGEVCKFGGFVESVPGRLELVANKFPKVFVDYAHTPDALDKVQIVLRDLVGPGGRLISVFGCGGDRDSKKRPLMGKSVLEKSDIAIVTSDNPRTEDPQGIIEDILGGIVPFKDNFLGFKLYVESDREKAIELAITMAGENDVVLVAGKGHEDYQIIGVEKRFFCDRTKVRKFFELREK